MNMDGVGSIITIGLDCVLNLGHPDSGGRNSRGEFLNYPTFVHNVIILMWTNTSDPMLMELTYKQLAMRSTQDIKNSV